MNRFTIDEHAQFEVIDICYHREDQKILKSMITLMNAFTDDNMTMMRRAWKCIEFLKVYIAIEYHPLIDQTDQDREHRMLYGPYYMYKAISLIIPYL